MKIKEHWLRGPGIVRQQTNKHSGPVDGPHLIVLHYTAGANALSSVEHLTHPQVQASAHLVIGREGTVWQLLPFHLAAWHAGLSHYQGRRGVNRFSIGIELDNAGKLKRRDNRFFTAFGQEVPPEEVYAHKQAGILTYWHRYTDIQAKRLEGIANLLLETYPSLSEVVGHSHITARKQDPGPALGSWAIRGREFHLELPEHQNNRIIHDLQNI